MQIAVVAEAEGTESAAENLAQRIGLQLLDPGVDPGTPLLLAFTDAGLVLRENVARPSGPLRVVFQPGRGSPLLRRAVLAGKAGVERAIDATAGLGQDAFAMAEAGLEVDLIERSPVVAALLGDGLARALADPATRDVAARLRIHRGDARELLPRLAPAEVVYLDPMYPTSGREGGKAKGMRILRALLGEDLDAVELLAPARYAATRRVAVKRPLKAPAFAGEKPSGSLKGTTVRYDLYAPAH